jgi:hypothetical protein
VLGVGPKVLGYLPGYLREEHYDNGRRFLIAAALHLPGAAVAAVAVGGALAWVLARRPPPAAAAAPVLGASLLAASPVQPWYAVALLAVATVAAEPQWAAVVLAGYPYFFAVLLASRHAAAYGQLAYGGAAIVVAVLAARHYRPGRAATDALGPPQQLRRV